MSQPLNADQELVSDVVACQLVIKQILDVLDVIAPVEVREKMSSQLKNIDFTNHPPPQTWSPCGQSKKPSRWLNSSLPHRANPIKKPLLQKNEAAVSQKLHRRNALAPMYDQCSWCDTTFRTCWSVCTGHIPASFALRTSSRMVCSNRPSCCCSFSRSRRKLTVESSFSSFASSANCASVLERCSYSSSFFGTVLPESSVFHREHQWL